MSSVYTASPAAINNSGTVQVTNPVDGDALSAASNNASATALADYVKRIVNFMDFRALTTRRRRFGIEHTTHTGSFALDTGSGVVTLAVMNKGSTWDLFGSCECEERYSIVTASGNGVQLAFKNLSGSTRAVTCSAATIDDGASTVASESYINSPSGDLASTINVTAGTNWWNIPLAAGSYTLLDNMLVWHAQVPAFTTDTFWFLGWRLNATRVMQ